VGSAHRPKLKIVVLSKRLLSVKNAGKSLTVWHSPRPVVAVGFVNIAEKTSATKKQQRLAVRKKRIKYFDVINERNHHKSLFCQVFLLFLNVLSRKSKNGANKI
jgi:hypothetical protein